MEYLFPNFLKDPAEFKDARKFWSTLCQEILIQNNQGENWEIRFESQLFENEDADIFPIYSLINCDATKAFVIQQQDPKIHTKWEMSAYINHWDEVDWVPKPPDDLAFVCNLTEKSANVCRELFSLWIRAETSRADMNKRIEEMNL
jgi:hypothetical protein